MKAVITVSWHCWCSAV